MTDEAELEAIKHQNAIILEERKWQFRKQELAFLEAGQHLRALNQQLWQVPGMVIAITGGIWYGALSIPDECARSLALLFAAAVNFVTIGIIWRLRTIIDIQIALQNNFNQIRRRHGKNIVVWCWTFLLLAAFTLSLLAAIYPPTTTTKPKASGTTNNYLYPEKIEIIKNEQPPK
ncbi:hypothetical protein ACMHYQ_04545 [Ectopseudomonas guguanensis]|uniref:hypothetical protein n=1 Tax=Ectopseudomonas guguanensis TaxID=1198456 RepID=UPI0039C03CD5